MVLMAIASALIVLWARAFYGAMETYERGEKLLEEGQTIRAITYFDRALHWYAPLNPYVKKATLKLWEIGEKAEKTGDTRMASIAFESIRSGYYGATHFVTPNKDWIMKAESKLSSLHREKAGRGEDSQALFSAKSPHPDPFWSAVVVFGFLGWIGGLIALIVKTFGKGGYRYSKSAPWLGFSLLCFILWIAGMVKA
jgi:hypothetical protein